MHKTAKAERSFGAERFRLLARWPTLVAFLLIAAFSGSGLQAAGSVLQQCRHLFDADNRDDARLVAKRENPRLAVAVAVSEKQKSTAPGTLDGIVPSAPAVPVPLRRTDILAVRHDRPIAVLAIHASARDPPPFS